MSECASPVNFIHFSHGDLEQSITARFEQQVQKYPDKLAIKTRSRSVSYAELNELVNLLAASVCSMVAENDVPVAVYFEQGITQIAAILAVLKAGRIYVALDPADSRERVDFMLEDSGAGLILTDKRNYRTVSARESASLKVLDIGCVEGVACDVSPGQVGPDSSAYIYYTSGSTGKPKGVYDSHRNVLHNVMRYTNGLQITANDGLVLLQSCTFSGSVSNIFCSLLNGATLYPVDLRQQGIDSLATTLKDEPVTIYHSVPAIFQQLMAHTHELPGLRVIRLEGDQSSMHHVRLFQKHFSRHCTLVNGLGATETGIVRTFTIRHDTVFEGSIVPVGYATQDMETLLVNEDGSEVSAGEAGEVMIRSRYLATGYWKNSEFSQEKFRHCPIDPDFRIYRTGDVGRMRPDGCLELMGRTDFQCKVMGRWVAIPEIESALMQIEGINEAVVILQRDTEDSRLIAYLVPEFPALPPTVSVIRRALVEQIPDHVHPARYVMLEALPLDAGGKVDRKSLLSAADTRPELDQLYVEPGNETEVDIAAIWCEVLDISRVGVNDDFFYLGGDSIKAVMIINRVNRRYSLRLSIAEIFAYPTVAMLSRFLRGL